MTSMSPLKLPAPNGRGCVTAPTDHPQRHCREDLPRIYSKGHRLILAKRKKGGKKGGLPRYLSIYAMFGSTTPSKDEGQGSSGYQVCSLTAAQTPKLCKVGERRLRSLPPIPDDGNTFLGFVSTSLSGQGQRLHWSLYSPVTTGKQFPMKGSLTLREPRTHLDPWRPALG